MNKVLFKIKGDELLHRYHAAFPVMARNPLTNTEVLGEVCYFTVAPASATIVSESGDARPVKLVFNKKEESVNTPGTASPATLEPPKLSDKPPTSEGRRRASSSAGPASNLPVPPLTLPSIPEGPSSAASSPGETSELMRGMSPDINRGQMNLPGAIVDPKSPKAHSVLNTESSTRRPSLVQRIADAATVPLGSSPPRRRSLSVDRILSLATRGARSGSNPGAPIISTQEDLEVDAVLRPRNGALAQRRASNASPVVPRKMSASCPPLVSWDVVGKGPEPLEPIPELQGDEEDGEKRILTFKAKFIGTDYNFVYSMPLRQRFTDHALEPEDAEIMEIPEQYLLPPGAENEADLVDALGQLEQRMAIDEGLAINVPFSRASSWGAAVIVYAYVALSVLSNNLDSIKATDGSPGPIAWYWAMLPFLSFAVDLMTSRIYSHREVNALLFIKMLSYSAFILLPLMAFPSDSDSYLRLRAILNMIFALVYPSYSFGYFSLLSARTELL